MPSVAVLSPDERNVWTPDAQVKDHNGEPPLPDRVYFAAPPPEIGKVLSASSTLKTGKNPMNPFLRVAIALTTMVIVFLPVYSRYDDFTNAMGIVLSLGIGIPIWIFTRFRHTCSYVGDRGFVRFTWLGLAGDSPQTEMMLFNNPVDLRAVERRLTRRGVSYGMKHDYTWRDESGKTVFELSGKYHGLPKPSDPVWFSRMAERAWTGVAAELMQCELVELGFIPFDVAYDGWIEIGPGYIAFSVHEGPVRLEVKDIESFVLKHGMFTLKTHDANWLSRKGLFQFEYAEVGNAQLFICAMEDAGFSIQLIPHPIEGARMQQSPRLGR